MCGRSPDGENVKISGFGSFILRDKGERVGRNPKTGVEVPIAPRRVLTFRASQIMRERIAKPAEAGHGGPSSARAIRPSDDRRAGQRPRRAAAYPALLGDPLPAAEAAAARRQPPLLPPADVALAHRIHRLLNQDGYTIRGVQQLLPTAETAETVDGAAGEAAVAATGPTPANQHAPFPAEQLRAIRKQLADALAEES
jgi:hypothetical protein